LLAFELVELLGRQEADELEAQQAVLLRVLTPIAKLLTAKQAVAVVSEAIEAFGGAGYVEDTGLPALLRDTQVLPIWEGTTNVLSLDAVLRGGLDPGIKAVRERIEKSRTTLRNAQLVALGSQASSAIDQIEQWLSANGEAPCMQAGAREVAMSLGRALQLALLCEHAQWSSDSEGDSSGMAAAWRFATRALVTVRDSDLEGARLLAR
jgi:acyl-CoA dehydrogenase